MLRGEAPQDTLYPVIKLTGYRRLCPTEPAGKQLGRRVSGFCPVSTKKEQDMKKVGSRRPGKIGNRLIRRLPFPIS
jgi:hypothetical protein